MTFNCAEAPQRSAGSGRPRSADHWTLSEPKIGTNRLHLDVTASDLQAEIVRPVGMGATQITDMDEYNRKTPCPPEAVPDHGSSARGS